MKAKLNPFVVGLFVMGALGLAVFGLISFGSARWFASPGRFIAYFDESVHGLDLGSAVKLRGVRVGRVTAIRIRYDASNRRSEAGVVCELEENVISDPNGEAIRITDRAVLRRLVGDGLRAKLKLTGITGLQVIELEFLDPDKFRAPVPAADREEDPVVPTAPSQMAELTESISEIVAGLQRVDLAGLSAELKQLVTSGNEKLSELDVRSMARNVSRAAEAIEQLAKAADANGVVTNLNAGILEVRRFAARLDGEITPLSAEAKAALRAVSQAAQSARGWVSEESGLRDEAMRALQRMSDAAAAVQALADYLERNPNSILTGKKHPARD